MIRQVSKEPDKYTFTNVDRAKTLFKNSVKRIIKFKDVNITNTICFSRYQRVYKNKFVRFLIVYFLYNVMHILGLRFQIVQDLHWSINMIALDTVNVLGFWGFYFYRNGNYCLTCKTLLQNICNIHYEIQTKWLKNNLQETKEISIIESFEDELEL